MFVNQVTVKRGLNGVLIYKDMGLFFSSKPKRVTEREWKKIRVALYDKLDRTERNELEMVFRADLFEDGMQEGITRPEFEAGMAWLRANMSKHHFESSDLEEIEEVFEKYLND